MAIVYQEGPYYHDWYAILFVSRSGGIYLREGPGFDYPTIKLLGYGTIVHYLKGYRDVGDYRWFFVRTYKGLEGQLKEHAWYVGWIPAQVGTTINVLPFGALVDTGPAWGIVRRVHVHEDASVYDAYGNYTTTAGQTEWPRIDSTYMEFEIHTGVSVPYRHKSAVHCLYSGRNYWNLGGGTDLNDVNTSIAFVDTGVYNGRTQNLRRLGQI